MPRSTVKAMTAEGKFHICTPGYCYSPTAFTQRYLMPYQVLKHWGHG